MFSETDPNGPYLPCAHGKVGRPKYYCMELVEGGNGVLCGKYVCQHGKVGANVRNACREVLPDGSYCGKHMCKCGRNKVSCPNWGGPCDREPLHLMYGCIHGKLNTERALCMEPGENGRKYCGNSLCDHGIQKNQCKFTTCGGTGTAFCACGERKEMCSGKDCGATGNALCPCGHKKYTCKNCLSLEQLMAHPKFCIVCLEKQLSWPRQRAKVRTCSTCDPVGKIRTEIVIRPMIKAALGGLEATILDDSILGGSQCDTTRRRPDALYERCDENGVNWRTAMIETDEHSHIDRQASCEGSKVADTAISYQAIRGVTSKVRFFRLNPDEYEGNVSLENRIAKLCSDVLDYLDGGWKNQNSIAPHVSYYYYSQKGQYHIEYMSKQTESVTIDVVG